MRIATVVTTVALLIFGVASMSLAATTNKQAGVVYTTYQGTVEELMPNQNAFMLKDKDDGKIVHLHADGLTFATLKVGDVVRVVEQGNNCVLTDVKKK